MNTIDQLETYLNRNKSSYSFVHPHEVRDFQLTLSLMGIDLPLHQDFDRSNKTRYYFHRLALVKALDAKGIIVVMER